MYVQRSGFEESPAYKYARTRRRGRQSRDANDDSSNNIMHFRSVLISFIKFSRLRRFFRKRDTLIMSIVNAALSIREESCDVRFPALSPPSQSTGNRAWIYEPSLGLAISD